MAADYDESHNLRPRNVFEAHLYRPFQRGIRALRERIADLNQRVHSPIFLDQHPGRAVPFMFPKLYDLGLVNPRSDDWGASTGFLADAPVVDLGAYLTPRNSNLIVGADGTFYWTSTNIAAWVSLTYDADPGLGTGNTDVNPLPVSDIFDAAVEQNGGALACNYFFGDARLTQSPTGSVRTCFDIQLYDKKRGRRLHEEHIPPQLLCAQGYDNKLRSRQVRLPPNTEIEPRVRVLEVRPAGLLDTDQAYAAAQFRAYLGLVFKGYKVLDV